MSFTIDSAFVFVGRVKLCRKGQSIVDGGGEVVESAQVVVFCGVGPKKRSNIRGVLEAELGGAACRSCRVFQKQLDPVLKEHGATGCFCKRNSLQSVILGVQTPSRGSDVL